MGGLISVAMCSPLRILETFVFVALLAAPSFCSINVDALYLQQRGGNDGSKGSSIGHDADFSATSIPLWPITVPGEHPGAVGDEYRTCLTHGVPVSDCKDLSVHNVTVPTITPYVVPNSNAAVVVAPGGGYGIL